MLRRFIFLCSTSLPTLLVASHATAGAFLLPEGHGQFIAGVGYSEGSRRFSKTGTALPTDGFRKATAGGYLEYGLTSYVSVIAAPTLSRQHGSGAENTVTGSDSSAFGARLQLYGTPGTVVAVQALVQPPLGGGDTTSQIASGGSRTFAVDLRVLVGPALGSKRTSNEKSVIWPLLRCGTVGICAWPQSTHHSLRSQCLITEQAGDPDAQTSRPPMWGRMVGRLAIHLRTHGIVPRRLHRSGENHA